MTPARFNAMTNIIIILVLLIIGAFMGYWVASSKQHNAQITEQLNRKLHVIGYIEASVTNYNLCTNAVNNLQAQAKTSQDKLQADMFQFNCNNYANDLDIGLMAITAYFKMDQNLQDQINSILSRKDPSIIDQSSQTTVQQILENLNKDTQKDKDAI